jgi:hypothetical protein
VADRPILFQAPLVRAIQAGEKSQTRRTAGLDLVNKNPEARVAAVDLRDSWWEFILHDGGTQRVRCPYGVAGDRLWARENGWERPARTPKMMREGADTWAPYYYDADGITAQEAADFKTWGFKRRPSIHMPRWASRITLDVTGIRVERLLSISVGDCIAEGAPGGHGAIAGYAYNASPLEHYMHIWQSINGVESWSANPWVWVIAFRTVEPATQ